MIELPEVADDGLEVMTIKAHSLEKYRFIAHYAAQFATAMKKKWDNRVYVDLFAGPGFARVEGAPTIYKGSPLLALGVRDPFDTYIMCESSKRSAAALRERIARLRPASAREARVLEIDVNDDAAMVKAAIPRGRRGHSVLTFCLADPFSLANLRFDTLRTITDDYVDLCLLVPTAMEIQRNIDLSSGWSSRMFEEYLGSETWREEWKAAKAAHPALRARDWVINYLGRRMRDDLGFLWEGPEAQVFSVQSAGVPKYDLMFFSHHPLGIKFARDAKKGIDLQRPLFG